MKTYSPKKEDINRQWYIVDATNQTLGRIATKIAVKLRGKDKPLFAPHVDCGDFVVVINAEKFKVTGNKMDAKMYHRHSGYPSGLKSMPLKDLLKKKPAEALLKAITGMIPANRLRKPILSKLKIYAGSEHPHEAQQPKPLT